jgi:hypothetical protein
MAASVERFRFRSHKTDAARIDDSQIGIYGKERIRRWKKYLLCQREKTPENRDQSAKRVRPSPIPKFSLGTLDQSTEVSQEHGWLTPAFMTRTTAPIR